MNVPPPIPNADLNQLRLLGIFHYVRAGLSVLFLGFLALHYTFMHFMIHRFEEHRHAGDTSPFSPDDLFNAVRWAYVGVALFEVASVTMNLLAAGYLRSQRRRTFCFVTAGLNCFSLPLGTVLGVFTIIILNRPSVERLYATRENRNTMES
jgi:hypothetical protein